MARLYVDSQYISLTLQDKDYHSRMFTIVQKHLLDYIVALQHMLPYVTETLSSVKYVHPAPDAIKNINFPHLYEDRNTFV